MNLLMSDGHRYPPRPWRNRGPALRLKATEQPLLLRKVVRFDQRLPSLIEFADPAALAASQTITGWQQLDAVTLKVPVCRYGYGGLAIIVGVRAYCLFSLTDIAAPARTSISSAGRACCDPVKLCIPPTTGD